MTLFPDFQELKNLRFSKSQKTAGGSLEVDFDDRIFGLPCEFQGLSLPNSKNIEEFSSLKQPWYPL
jgi:hypothetical protein